MTENELTTIPINFETKYTDNKFCSKEVQEELRKILNGLCPGIQISGDFTSHPGFDSYVLWYEPTDGVVPIVLKHTKDNIYCIHLFDLLRGKLEYLGYIVYDLYKISTGNTVTFNLDINDYKLDQIHLKIRVGYLIENKSFNSIFDFRTTLKGCINDDYPKILTTAFSVLNEGIRAHKLRAKFWIT